jgi:AraC-like DNA-binding protein
VRIADQVAGEVVIPGIAVRSLVSIYRIGTFAPTAGSVITVSPPTCETELVLAPDPCMLDHARGATVSTLVGGMRVVSVVFRPGAGPFLFRVSADEVVDAVVDAEDLLPSEPIAELQRVHELRDRVAVGAALDRVILRLLLRIPARAHVPSEESSWLHEVIAGEELATVAARSTLSRRQIERRFRDAFGMSPSRLRRIERFRRASRQLVVEPGASLARLAAACGFSDQAHMTREFRALAGVPPTGYVTKRAGAFYLDAPIAPASHSTAAARATRRTGGR